MCATKTKLYHVAATGVFAMLLGPQCCRLAAGEARDEIAKPPVFHTAPVTRGDLALTIGATGTLEPEEVVDVGAEVTGRIASLGADTRGKTVESGSPVEAGAVLAKIDDAVYVIQVEQARAAGMRAEAELAVTQARLELAEAQWQRAQEQNKGKTISTAEFDLAKANARVAQAALAGAKASVDQARAVLKETELNLTRTRICSPVKGIVLACRANVGQTVAADANAPSLFLIAKDLERLQVWASVNEADIGQVREGQAVRFTVDARPGEVFRGSVKRIRLNATMTQNVVTYTVVAAAENRDGKLLPYQSANARFEVGRHKDVLLVPNAALRWRPQPQQIAADAREKLGHLPGAQADRRRVTRVWVPDGNFARPIEVQSGPTDGSVTEVAGDEVKEGMEVIVNQ